MGGGAAVRIRIVTDFIKRLKKRLSTDYTDLHWLFFTEEIKEKIVHRLHKEIEEKTVHRLHWFTQIIFL